MSKKWTMDYTKERKGAKYSGRTIEYCPSCEKKGLLTKMIRVDQYVHSEDRSESSLFTHISNQKECQVEAPERKALFERIKKITGSLSSKEGYHIIWNPETALVQILANRIALCTRRIKQYQAEQARFEEALTLYAMEEK